MFPFGYQPIEPTTWAYVSSLLMLALFFKFNRFWSVRNFDLVLIVLVAPGLLLVHYGANPPSVIIQRFEVMQDEELQTDLRAPPLPGDGTSDRMGVIRPTLRAGEQADRNPASLVGSLSTDRPSATRFAESTLRGNATARLRQDRADTAPALTDENVGNVENEDVTAADDDVDDLGEGDEGDREISDSGNRPPSLTPLEEWRRRTQRRGFLYLFIVAAVWLVRMLIDPSLTKKPFLEANLSIGGLAFLVGSLMVFLFANLIASRSVSEDIYGPRDAVKMIQGQEFDVEHLKKFGPGYAFFHFLPTFSTFANDRQMLREDADDVGKLHKYEIAAKTMAIISQIAIVLALIYFGKTHFNDLATGIGMAAIYLMLPYTSQMSGRVMHLLPAALLLWSIAAYRIPLLSGVLLGLAGSVAYYPLFLIPLFVSFYWFSGRSRFVSGLLAAIVLAIASLWVTSGSLAEAFSQLRGMFAFWWPQSENLEGIWSLGWPPIYRMPFIAGFVALAITFAAWPNEKTLGSLIGCSCAAMIAVQFWHGFGGGLYVGWYMPLALLVFFRPNLDDLTAENRVRRRPRYWGRDKSSDSLAAV